MTARSIQGMRLPFTLTSTRRCSQLAPNLPSPVPLLPSFSCSVECFSVSSSVTSSAQQQPRQKRLSQPRQLQPPPVRYFTTGIHNNAMSGVVPSSESMDGKHHHTTHGAQIPAMLYGTAWKKERTADLVYEAIKAGFRGIDTAGMKRHYDEAGTGEGIRRAIREGLVKRDDLWIQTKFTPNDADYASKPQEYPTVAAQVRASVASSLRNLSTPSSPGHDSSSSPVDSVPYLDCLIMHSAYPRVEDTVEAWNTLREFVPAQIRTLGISNISYQEFQEYQTLEDFHLVQNRFTRTESDWDVELRRDCLEHEILYQGFWTLTGNRADVQKAGFVRELADAVGISKEAAWYSLLIFGPGILVLNGTTNPERMRHDLEAVEKVEEWKKTDRGKEVWRRVEHDVIEFTCNQAGAPYEHVRDDGGFLCDKE